MSGSGAREGAGGAPLHGWILRWWAGEAGAAGTLASWAALPLEASFRAAVRARNAAYDRGWLASEAPPVPVVSVGNLTVGGTGKTPVTAWIAARLSALGARPAVVVRGYGRDEVLLHRRWNPDVPVVVGRRRLDGIRRAARGGAGTAVLDDGFQHRSVARDLDVVLVAVEQGGAERLLPRGPFREPLTATARADIVVLTRKTEGAAAVTAWERRVRLTAPGVPVVHVRLAPGGWLGLDGKTRSAPRGATLAVTSVADPRPFLTMAGEATGRRPRARTYPDHHEYTDADVESLRRLAGDRTLVTTEKDAVKLRSFADRLADVRVLRLVVEVERGSDVLQQALAALTETAAPAGPG